MTIYTEYGIPDPGEILVQAVGEVAGERVATAVAGEVQRRRRADGTLVAADMSAFKKEKHTPLNGLGGLLAFEEISVSAWAESGFGMMQKRSARRQVEQIWRNDGLDAAAQWVLANAKHPPRLASLTDSLERNARNPMGHLEDAFWRNLKEDIRKWK